VLYVFSTDHYDREDEKMLLRSYVVGLKGDKNILFS